MRRQQARGKRVYASIWGSLPGSLGQEPPREKLTLGFCVENTGPGPCFSLDPRISQGQVLVSVHVSLFPSKATWARIAVGSTSTYMQWDKQPIRVLKRVNLEVPKSCGIRALYLLL